MPLYVFFIPHPRNALYVLLNMFITIWQPDFVNTIKADNLRVVTIANDDSHPERTNQ